MEGIKHQYRTLGHRGIRGILFLCIAALTLSISIVELSAEPPQAAIKNLSADEFQVRDEASKQLSEWANKNLTTSPEELYKTWSKLRDPEARARCFSLMKQVVVLRKFGKGKGYLGVMMREVAVPRGGNAGKRGVMLLTVEPGTPAERAKLLQGDIVTQIDKIDLTKVPEDGLVDSFSGYIQSKEPGDTITLKIIRNGKPIEKKATLIKRPPEADRFQRWGDNPENRLNDEELHFKLFLHKQKKAAK
ncbi:MAG: S1C family serine protease [Akkermansiaceae bacterium]